MPIIPFRRIVSKTTNVFLGIDREQAAFNAANFIGDNPDLVARNPSWPSLQKFKNDDSAEAFSPNGDVPNPDYIWDEPTSDGQTVSFATVAANSRTGAGDDNFSLFLVAFADNAIEAKIELFARQSITGFTKVSPQPDGLGDVLFVAGDPNNPAIGLTINDPPFTFQDIRVYSTSFTVPVQSVDRYRIVVSFEVTNYLIQPIYSSNPSSLNNPAGLQFMVDLYLHRD